MGVESRHIDALLEVVHENTGTDLTGYRRSTLSRRISQRLSRFDIDAHQYLGVCRNSKDECGKLIDAVAINVSSFFRDSGVFETIASRVLPDLIPGKREFRVWSAGCAAGEEAYSVAILIQDVLERVPNADLQPIIFATDIDEEILKKAEAAYYPRESLKDTKLGIVDTYFSPVKDGFALDPKVKQKVHFSVDDLLSTETVAPPDSIYGSFDIILCRNVLIYFSPKHQKQVLKKLYDSLAQGGYLVLGDSEELSRELKSRFNTYDAGNRIYRK